MCDCQVNLKPQTFLRRKFNLKLFKQFSSVFRRQQRYQFYKYKSSQNSSSETLQQQENIQILQKSSYFQQEDNPEQPQQQKYQNVQQYFQQYEQIDSKQQNEGRNFEQDNMQFMDLEFVEQESKKRRALTRRLRQCTKPKQLQSVLDANRHLLNTTHISAACAAMAHMLQRNPPFPLNSISFTLTQLIEFVDANIDQLDGAELATCVWMMGKISQAKQRRISDLGKVLKQAFEHALALRTSLTDVDVTRFLWTAAKIKCVESDLVNQMLVFAQQIQPSQFKARGATTVLWVMATLGIQNQEQIGHFAQIAAGDIQGVTNQGLANGLWALKKLRYRHENLLFEAENVIQNGYYGFSWKQVSMIYSAFSDSGVKNQSTLEILSDCFTKVMRAPRIPKFSDWNEVLSQDDQFENYGSDQSRNVVKQQNQAESENQPIQNYKQLLIHSSQFQYHSKDQNQADQQDCKDTNEEQKIPTVENKLSTKSSNNIEDDSSTKNQGVNNSQIQLDSKIQEQQQEDQQNNAFYRSDDTAYYSRYSRIETGITTIKILPVEFDPPCIVIFSMAILNQPIHQVRTISDAYFNPLISFHNMGITAMCFLRRAQLQYQARDQHLILPWQLQIKIQQAYKQENKQIRSQLLEQIFKYVQQHFEQAELFVQVLDGELCVDVGVQKGGKKIAVQVGIEGELLGGAKAYNDLLEWQGWKVVQVPYFKWQDLQFRQTVLETIRLYLESC